MRTYTWGAGRQLRHISMLTGEEHGFRVSNGVHEDSNTLLRIVHDVTNSKLKAKLLRDGRDVTDECAASAFVWTKDGSAAGTGKEITVTDAEVNGDVQFSCAYTEIQGVYGTVSVGDNLVATHDPATADAKHVFTLENGMLKVEIPNSEGNGTDYELIDGVLSVNPGFTGTIIAEYIFTTAPTREIDFEYDHNGLRTQKKVVENGITTIYDYTLHDKLITHLTKRVVDLDGVETSEELHFFYDVQSRPAFVEYEGTKYRYIHNLQGDIMAIVDTAGNPVVEYKYDAWGNPLSVDENNGNNNATVLATFNPFRYRGYMYDDETGLYYLRSRYYNLYWNRFLNADALLVGRGLLNHNLYAYCKNTPVLLSDPNGAYPGEPTKLRTPMIITFGTYDKQKNHTAVTVYVERKVDQYTTEYSTYYLELVTGTQRFSYCGEKGRTSDGELIAEAFIPVMLEKGVCMGLDKLGVTCSGGFGWAITIVGLISQLAENELSNELSYLHERLSNEGSSSGVAYIDRVYYSHTEGLGSSQVFEDRYYTEWVGLNILNLII